MSSSDFLWALVLLLGIPMLIAGLTRFLIRRSLDKLEQFERQDLAVIQFERFPWLIRDSLLRSKQTSEAAGFSELVSFVTPSSSNPEFHCVMISPDRTIVCDIYYLRPGFWMTLLLLISQPKTLLLGFFGFKMVELVTVYENYFQLLSIDSKFPNTASYTDREFLPQSKLLSFEQRVDAHRSRSIQIAREMGFVASRFDKTADYIEFKRKMRSRRIAEARRTIEGAESDLDKDTFEP